MSDPNVLYITNGSPSYMPPLRLAERQVEMGPNMPDLVSADGRIRCRLGAGEIHPADLTSRLPEGFVPDLIFIQASSYRCARPIGLASLPGRKFLVIADLHHGSAPITSMLRYAETEPFDGVIVTHGAHFAHWFEEQKRCPVTVIPNFNVAGHRAPFQTVREPTILFIGQAGDFHPRRRHLLNAIKTARLSLIEGQATPEDAAKLYGEAQIVFNCSLNGDINMRVFETLAAGGCLITDRLSSSAGLNDLFSDGLHLSLYDDASDLMGLLQRLLARPHEALALARNGQSAYWDRHSPEQRKHDVLNFVQTGKGPDLFFARAIRDQDKASLMERAAIYERLQEAQRSCIAPIPLYIDPALPDLLSDDASDLHLLRQTPWTDAPTGPCAILAHVETRLQTTDAQTTLITYSPPAHQG